MVLSQNVSAHPGLGSLPNKLKELWLEVGGSCHLNCYYCFANSDGLDKSKDNVNIHQIKKYLNEFVEIGGDRIGIVGAGEPFHARNISDTLAILEYAKEKKLHTTIFTTTDLIDEKLIKKLDEFPNITLMVKYNSQIPEVQDKMVSSQGYTQRRDKAMKLLISKGYNDGKRLGVVTSILEENAKEMSKIFRFARDNNIIFDVDTPIPRGRGSNCDREKIGKLAKPVIKELAKIDKEEYGNVWDSHATYIASLPCTRFNQHLYVKKDGLVMPCVGSPNVILGNVKEESIKDIWDKKITLIIREHKYKGKCTSCKNFKEGKCFSCLGRSTKNLNTESLLRKGYVETIGCFQYRK
ncbi:radical SAM/SPASM domain-containing protein [Nanoarchaeota archaeon]